MFKVSHLAVLALAVFGIRGAVGRPVRPERTPRELAVCTGRMAHAHIERTMADELKDRRPTWWDRALGSGSRSAIATADVVWSFEVMQKTTQKTVCLASDTMTDENVEEGLRLVLQKVASEGVDDMGVSLFHAPLEENEGERVDFLLDLLLRYQLTAIQCKRSEALAAEKDREH
ncbi:hypothetical protein LTR37_008947 [Vermiconidia calcicola]|uniref:Uncharacterized protein n=1 Tax=Vermiconidia calcicola TaxID=1690605 RepID=A0ACC3N933_9PEZI|nr:hypothetical protein LTR37_008947 [Vermiconidia calcicola]